VEEKDNRPGHRHADQEHDLGEAGAPMLHRRASLRSVGAPVQARVGAHTVRLTPYAAATDDLPAGPLCERPTLALAWRNDRPVSRSRRLLDVAIAIAPWAVRRRSRFSPAATGAGHDRFAASCTRGESATKVCERSSRLTAVAAISRCLTR
jgi:hypothetical protein